MLTPSFRQNNIWHPFYEDVTFSPHGISGKQQQSQRVALKYFVKRNYNNSITGCLQVNFINIRP